MTEGATNSMGAGEIPGIDTAVPHTARVWNYWLGGKDNYLADRELGDQIVKVFPAIVDVARHSRAFLRRAVRYLAEEAGVRQYLDIGTGLPTADNTHEVVQRIAPDSRVVYVDNDPLVLVHARALLAGTPQGVVDYLDADVREPKAILEHAARILDFGRPVALMLLGVMEHIEDDEQAYAIVRELVDGLPSGSYLVLNDATPSPEREEALRLCRESGSECIVPRTPEQIARFFEGLELLPPGVVSASRWRAEQTPFGEPPEVETYCGVARKP
ncbi:SAM-dependent methyltransferase [Thermomonospora sp. CIF 1]|uniref:SAM-dependent methyltransferase n=1 Tax=Thermomonospora sp. CIF 1 TaxID=1916083 RepID=UPI000A813CCE|nr:SAM-dependent methyltransferase [Thermomonospora sp. CIF 1]PKK12570.1 MAG: S-adenosyl methyltransferase [Thermomonospora sp. CIF 1]